VRTKVRGEENYFGQWHCDILFVLGSAVPFRAICVPSAVAPSGFVDEEAEAVGCAGC
jgi:hypothetical protein